MILVPQKIGVNDIWYLVFQSWSFWFWIWEQFIWLFSPTFGLESLERYFFDGRIFRKLKGWKSMDNPWRFDVFFSCENTPEIELKWEKSLKNRCWEEMGWFAGLGCFRFQRWLSILSSSDAFKNTLLSENSWLEQPSDDVSPRKNDKRSWIPHCQVSLRGF